jgi:flagella basal body P-ring formation protein FlgA
LKKLLGLFILSLFFSLQVLAEKAEVTFLPQAYVDHDQIYLSDLVEKSDASAPIQNKMKKIVVAETPKNGEVSKLSSFAISEILRFNLKDQVHDLNIRIPNKIEVYRKNNKITADEIKAKLIAWVQPTCQPCTIDIQSLQIQNGGVIEPLLHWELPTTQILPKGNFNISIDLYNNDNFVKKVFAQGVLRIYKSIPVAKRSLPFGVKIQKEDYAFQKQDVTFNHEVAPLETELLGSETAQSVSPNQPLWKSVLKRRVALTRGAPVQVLLQDQGWSIHFSGIAQDSGYVGDVAKVLNPDTKKIITGIITDENIVEVK